MESVRVATLTDAGRVVLNVTPVIMQLACHSREGRRYECVSVKGRGG